MTTEDGDEEGNVFNYRKNYAKCYTPPEEELEKLKSENLALERENEELKLKKEKERNIEKELKKEKERNKNLKEEHQRLMEEL